MITMDASLTGWNTCKVGMMQGTWSKKESSNSISLLELRAIRLGLLAFQNLLSGQHILGAHKQCDNQSFCEPTRRCQIHDEAKSLMNWAESHLKSLQVVHVEGQDNSGGVAELGSSESVGVDAELGNFTLNFSQT